jgi:serine/threonine protein phosphatase PrpC
LDIEFGARSDQGKVRDSNEDTYIADKNRIFLVADGMGGHAAGEIASQLAAETVKNFLLENKSDIQPEILQHAVEEANTRVFKTQAEKAEFRGMGSTLTVLVFSGSGYHIAQVGDSRAYLFRNGALNQLTQDHSVVWPLYENGILTKDDISKHPQKNLITRSIGTYQQVEADIYSDTVFGGDLFLLCSDGLTDVLTDQDIFRIVSIPAGNMQDLADRLVEEANTAGGPDNITVVVVRIAAPDK